MSEGTGDARIGRMATRIYGSAADAAFERDGCVAGANVYIFSGAYQYSGTVRECSGGSLCVCSGEWHFTIFVNSGGSFEASGVVPGTTRTLSGCVVIVKVEDADEDEDEDEDEELAAAAEAVLSLASDESSVDASVPSEVPPSSYTDDENGKREDDAVTAIGLLACERAVKLRASTLALEMVDEWDQKAQQVHAGLRMCALRHLERLRYEAAMCSLVAVKLADAMVRLDAPAMRGCFTSAHIMDVRTRALVYTKSANFASTHVHMHTFMRTAIVIEATGVDELMGFLLELTVV